MADLEARVGAALTAATAEVTGAAGLAAGARDRRRMRRRRRLVGLGTLVVLAGAVPLSVVVMGRDDAADQPRPLASEVVDHTDDGWQTVRLDDTEVDIPGDWVQRDTDGCPLDLDPYGPPGVPRCSEEGMYFLSGMTADNQYGPGVREVTRSPTLPDARWGGYALGGGTQEVSAYAVSRDVVTRILASARVAGESPPDPTGVVRIESWRGLRVEVPVSWFAQEAPCVQHAAPGDPAVEYASRGSSPSCTSVSQGYGARFFDASSADFATPFATGRVHRVGDDTVWPAGAWVGQVSSPTSRSVGVFVVARDRATARAVLDSVRYRGERVPRR